MKCRDIQDSLNQMFTFGGLDLSPGAQTHLETCPECREYYEDLVDLNQDLAPLTDIALTPEEAARLNTGLTAKIEKLESAASRSATRRIFTVLAPLSLAAAAVLALLLWSPWQHYVLQPTSTTVVGEFQFDKLKSDDILPLLTSNDADLLPALIDEKTASYITEQVKPMQADELLESLSKDEIKWLNDNLSMEI